MRSVHLSALTVLALGALAPSAFAAQTFTFANPFAGGGASFANSQFETGGIIPGSTPGIASLESFNEPPIVLTVVGGSTAGSYGATYDLLDSGGGTVFTGAGNPSGTATSTEGGTLTFRSTGVTSFGPAGTTLLTYTFTPGFVFGLSGFGAAASLGSPVVVAGVLVDGILDQSQSKFSFSFPGSFVDPLDPNTRHYTAGFTSSVQVVPEPASMGALAIGAVALLRRRKRA